MSVAPSKWITTSDGVRLAYDRAGVEGPAVVLIHGWSGSKHYFDLNIQSLAKRCQVYAYDQRFHGESGKPTWGYHVARLAADLKELLEALRLQDVTVVGTSMGCAVIWSYIELFGEARLAKCVFVDQAPLQNLAEDWSLGSKGCYDAASLARLQTRLELDFRSIALGNLAGCLSLPVRQEVAEALVKQTMLCDPRALARLMADHTQLDWRPILPRIKLPCLNVVGRQSSVFPWQGSEMVGHLIPACRTVFFEAANHWLYIEEPEKFNSLVKDFVAGGLTAMEGRPDSL